MHLIQVGEKHKDELPPSQEGTVRPNGGVCGLRTSESKLAGVGRTGSQAPG